METRAEREVSRQRARRAEVAVEVLVVAGVFGRAFGLASSARRPPSSPTIQIVLPFIRVIRVIRGPIPSPNDLSCSR